jgi:glyoxylase-like metal-dependent hydrolase (beta-lactamase superfamily II)
MEDFMKANVTLGFSVAVLALATATPGVRISAAPNPQVKPGVDRLYVIDCGDGSGPDESRWTPGVNVGTPVGFPGHCYLIHHTEGWVLWDTGIDDAVAQLPNHEEVFHEWGPGTGPVWRKPITLAAQLEEIHVKPSDIKLMAVSHSHPDHAGNIEMFPNTLMLVQRVEYEWAGSRQDTVAFNKQHPVKLVDGDYDIFGDGSLVLLSTPGHTPGHQSLLVRLPKTGAVILSGDVVHFQTSFEHRYVPDNNWNKQASLRSMDKISAVMRRNMRSSGLTTISTKATRKRSCRRITSDGQLATCRKGLIGSDTSWSKLTYLLMAAKGLSRLSSFSEESYAKQDS